MTFSKAKMTFALLCLAPQLQAATVPIIQDQQFQKGHHWTWTYFTAGDPEQFYSAERYEVIQRSGSTVTIEMRTQYESGSPFVTHTRFRVDLKKCFQAFRRPDVKTQFSIALIPLMNGTWGSPITTAATAFEEKFNCNPHVHSGKTTLYETRFDSVAFEGQEQRLFQQWPKNKNSQLLSYYFLEQPDLAGVAYRKDFNPGTANFYRMQLTDWGFQ